MGPVRMEVYLEGYLKRGCLRRSHHGSEVLYVREEASWAREAKAGDQTLCGGSSGGAAASIVGGGTSSCRDVTLSLVGGDVVVLGVETLPGEDLACVCATRGLDSESHSNVERLLSGARFVVVRC